jgi:hypothetical protein
MSEYLLYLKLIRSLIFLLYWGEEGDKLRRRKRKESRSEREEARSIHP